MKKLCFVNCGLHGDQCACYRKMMNQPDAGLKDLYTNAAVDEAARKTDELIIGTIGERSGDMSIACMEFPNGWSVVTCDGEPILELSPIDCETFLDAGSHKVRITRKYRKMNDVW